MSQPSFERAEVCPRAQL